MPVTRAIKTSLGAYATGEIINHPRGEPDREPINREPKLASEMRVGELMGSEGVELFVDMVS
jgi:hypothetical protein